MSNLHVRGNGRSFLSIVRERTIVYVTGFLLRGWKGSS